MTKEKQMTEAERSRANRTVMILVDPANPEMALLIWKGRPIAGVLEVFFSLKTGLQKLTLVRAPAVPKDDPVWEEMRVAGVKFDSPEEKC